MRILIVAVVCGLASSVVTNAQQPAHKKGLDATRLMTISYGSPSWNKDSAKIDTAVIVLREKNSGKLVQITLEETEPDSSEFRGSFSVNLTDAETLSPEIYVPTAELRDGDNYKKLYDAIANGSLPRKPVIMKKNERGQSMIDVYDTREQAADALKAFQEQQKAKELAKRTPLKLQPNAATLEAARQAERKAALEKAALEAANRETERVRLEQIEKQRQEERARQAKLLSAQEQAARRAKANELASEADKLYDASAYPEAEAKYQEAVSLDPANKSHYFKYGVTLYRNQKYNEALVILKNATGDAKVDAERRYYIGLCHYRLSELDQAQRVFAELSTSKDPIIGPSALFYNGVILFAQEKYEPAKKAFEDVIDVSKDPKLDEQAEEYLDRVASAMSYKKMRENKFSFTGTVGVMYDSNVLLSPDNAADQGSATNSADERLMTIADLAYRPIFNEHHEWSADVSANLTNSLKAESAKADPFIYDIAAPYSYKGMLFSKGYRLTVKPSYELLYMDPTGTGTKAAIQSSTILNIENSFVMDKNWFSVYSLEDRLDDTKTADSIGPDDADASKYSLKTTQMYFLDKSKKEVLMGNLGYVLNIAKGDNKKYNRMEGGVTYLRPMKWDATWNVGLAYYVLNYNKAVAPRKDGNYSLSAGITKPIKDWVTWGLMGNYTKNKSSIDSYTYGKYTVMTTATFNTIF